jgi:hypothetical protein
MRMPTMARSTVSRFAFLAVGALSLAACSSDMTSSIATPDASLSKGVHFNPGIGNKPVVAVGETQTYTFTIDPTVANRLDMGTQTLEMPANAVCDLSSGYGAAYWNAPCAPRTAPITITATVIGTGSYPRVEFQPAMRFNPLTEVELYMFAKHASLADAQRFKILYCSTLLSGSCGDESATDASLITKYSTHDNEIYRRIKHFSGYVVAEYTDSGTVSIGADIGVGALLRAPVAQPSDDNKGPSTAGSTQLKKKSGYIIASS